MSQEPQKENRPKGVYIDDLPSEVMQYAKTITKSRTYAETVLTLLDWYGRFGLETLPHLKKLQRISYAATDEEFKEILSVVEELLDKLYVLVLDAHSSPKTGILDRVSDRITQIVWVFRASFLEADLWLAENLYKDDKFELKLNLMLKHIKYLRKALRKKQVMGGGVDA